MVKDNFYNLKNSEKQSIFEAIANEKGMTSNAVEKDWWVSRSLEIIFKMDIAKHLVFKGGTSLSKGWKLINRFSEDIDLAIDREIFLQPENNWSRGEIKKLRKTASTYSTGIFFEELKSEFNNKGYKDIDFKIVESTDSDQDPRIIEIYYPNIIKAPSEYLLPRVQIEIGCRSLKEPFSMKKIGSLVDEHYYDKSFASPLFEVPTVNPERTFLEKIFLLHEEFQRAKDKIRVDRLSRHLYDIFYLSKSEIGSLAIHNKELYETIVSHRFKFSKVGTVNYNLHNPVFINPIPIPEVFNAWKADYNKMKNEMIYEEDPPKFERIIDNLQEIKSQLQSLSWKFELSFPTK
jgi:hypothetical protein